MRNGTASADPTIETLAASLGLRPVDRLRVMLGDGPVVAEVTGLARRHRRTVRVSLACAARLAAAGAPLRIEHRRDRAAAAAAAGVR